MLSSSKWFLLGALVSLASCKSDPAPPKVTAEKANPTPSAAPAPSASAVTSAPGEVLEPYGLADMLADIDYCSQFWLGGINKVGGRCDFVEPLWAAGGVEAAVAKYKSGCDNKDGEACLLLIGALAHPKSPMQSKDKAVFIEDASALLVKACEFGQPNACAEVVSHYTCVSDKEGYPKSEYVCTKAIVKFLQGKKHPEFAALLEPGCKKGHAASCTGQGDHVKEVKGQIDEVTDLYKRACSLGDGLGCIQAQNVAKKFGNDAEAADQMNKKFKWDQRRCRRLDECGDVAGDFEKGWHGPGDVPKIREMLTQYCAKPKAHESTCLVLAQMQVKGTGGPADAAAAVPRLEATCKGTIDPDDPAMALEPISIACRMLSNLYKNGTGVAKDEAKAKTLMKRACIQRDPSTPEIDAACKDLKEMGN